MKNPLFASLFLSASLLVPAAVCADGVTFVRGAFTSGPERDAPSDEAAMRAARRVFYAFELNNPNAPTQVRVQWTYDSRPLPVQTMDVGRAPRWRLWSIVPRRAVGHVLEVTIQDLAGATLHTERLELR